MKVTLTELLAQAIKWLHAREDFRKTAHPDKLKAVVKDFEDLDAAADQFISERLDVAIERIWKQEQRRQKRRD